MAQAASPSLTSTPNLSIRRASSLAFREPMRPSPKPAPVGLRAAASNAITDNWWVRADYRYSNFGHTTDFPFTGELPFPNSFVFLRHHLSENQAQASFSYRFDWTAPQPAVPVVAKY